jgi:hypothetical protein
MGTNDKTHHAGPRFSGRKGAVKEFMLLSARSTRCSVYRLVGSYQILWSKLSLN